MILITGGIFQGRLDFAIKNFGSGVYTDITEKIRDLVCSGADRAATDKFIEDYIKKTADSVVITTETGCGIVPAEKKESEYREVLGRANIRLAAAADQVWVVCCGLGRRIK
jgi:adenosylcobinamide kinase/adenosylcobinamide-phosphate guanylyltransferase